MFTPGFRYLRCLPHSTQQEDELGVCYFFDARKSLELRKKKLKQHIVLVLSSTSILPSIVQTMVSAVSLHRTQLVCAPREPPSQKSLAMLQGKKFRPQKLFRHDEDLRIYSQAL